MLLDGFHVAASLNVRRFVSDQELGALLHFLFQVPVQVHEFLVGVVQGLPVFQNLLIDVPDPGHDPAESPTVEKIQPTQMAHKNPPIRFRSGAPGMPR